jgi:hypothetical protein
MDSQDLESEQSVFADAYVSTALADVADQCGIAADCDGECNGGHLPVGLTVDDLDPGTLERLRLDAREFFGAHAADLALYPGEHRYTPDQWAERGGELFWMDRSGHGTGFGDWHVYPMPDDVAAARGRLMETCRTEGERELFPGLDGKITHGKSWGEIQRERADRTPGA